MKLKFKKSNNKLIDIVLLINAGALDDTKEGVAHFLEHLLLSSNNIWVKELENKGIVLNASTSQDSIIVSTSVLSIDLIYTVKMLKKIVFNWEISDEVFLLERKLIQKEILEQDISIEKINFVKFLSQNLKLNLHNERGSIESLKEIKKSDVLNFYEKYVNEQNSVICISGKVSFVNKLKITNIFKKEPSLQVNAYEFTGESTILKVDNGLDNCHLFFLTPNNGLFNINKLYYELFAIVFFSTFSKFWKEVRTDKSLIYYMDYENIFIKNTGVLATQIDVSKKDLDMVYNILLNSLSVSNINLGLFKIAKKCLFMQICDDYDKRINLEAELKRDLFNKSFSFNYQKKYLKHISYESFIEFSKNIINNKKYSILIQK